MEAYVLENVGKLELKDVDMPSTSEDEVIVEVKAAGICGSDIPRIFETGTYIFPTIPGHEFSGVVVACSSDKKLVGKRVGVFPLIPCKQCEQCKQKKYEMCINYDYLGSRSDGGFAEYVKVPKWNLIELSENVTYEEGAMLEPSAVALHAVRNIDLENTISAVVYGAGTIGILCALWLRKLGVSNVIIIVKYLEQKKFLEGIGFENVSCVYEENPTNWVLRHTDNKGADVVFECVGSNDSISSAILLSRAGGKIVLVGNPKSDVEIAKDMYWKILRRQLVLVGSWNSGFNNEEVSDWDMTLQAIEDGSLPVGELITDKIPFENLNQGLQEIKDKSRYIVKMMITR